jgi:hypothetical protein
MLTTQNVVAKTAVKDEREPLTMHKRVGSTTYVVSVRFCENAKETLEQKMLRIIDSEVNNYAC